MLDKNPHPTDAQIRETMNGTLCRCMTYYRVQAAIKRAAKTIAEARPSGEGGGGMSASTEFRNRSKNCWSTHRRGFLKSAGLLAGELRRGTGA